LNLIVLRFQKFGEVGAVLAGDPGDESSFAACRKRYGHLLCSLARAVRHEIRATPASSTVCANCFSHFQKRELKHPLRYRHTFTFPQMRLLGSVPVA
jgi:hypothetical protein